MVTPNRQEHHPEDIRNLVIFVIASLAVWLVFDHFLLKPRMEELKAAREMQREAQVSGQEAADEGAMPRPREAVIAEEPQRLVIDSPRLKGSIALTGGRIDDISLKEHYQTMEKLRNVVLFSPMGSYHPRYVSFGWTDPTRKIPVPGKNTRWQVTGGGDAVLRPGAPVTLFWDNGQGVRFEHIIELDEHYLFTLRQRIVNTSGKSITLYPYALIAQHGLPEELYGRWIIHEGPVGYIDNELIEISYNKMKKNEEFREIGGEKGWLGLTEHYWLSALFPENDAGNVFRFVYVTPETAGQNMPRYQIDVMGPGRTLQNGDDFENVTRLYVGPKKLSAMESYERKFGWNHIDLAVDFGMWYFLTKPLYYLLHWLGDLAGNFGLGIILLTFVVRLFVFPLANTSYRSFAKLRLVAPQMRLLRDKYGDDKEKLQAELVKLYEKEKVNPMAGCLPILIQIPIFFALFKVLQISVEMRHAPFYGWIKDLSAPDPTSIFNLFGLIPWEPWKPLMIGVWPCMMLIFMILQKKMSPPPQDKMQKAMMDFMPFFITYILAAFPAGLVIYWTFSNALSVVQQYIIMKSMGVEPHLFKTKEDKEMERQITEGPSVHPELEVAGHDVEEALFGEGEGEAVKKPVSKPRPKKSKKKK